MSPVLRLLFCRFGKHLRRERFGSYSDKCLDCSAVIVR